jgi:hypothetical protein
LPDYAENSSDSEDILQLLKKLKRNANWLLSFIIDSKANPIAASVDTEMTVSEILSKCSSHLRARILSELKGIEKRYELEGYPPNFESIPSPEFSGSATKNQLESNEQRLFLMAKDVLSSEGVEFQLLSSIQLKFLTHYRCEFCGLVPLYSIQFLDSCYRCGTCGNGLHFADRGKYGRVRSQIVQRYANETTYRGTHKDN